MLTQQITKSLLTLQVERQGELPIQTSMAQISQGRQGFNNSLQTLGDSLLGEFEFSLFGIDAGQLSDTVAGVEREWRPLDIHPPRVLTRNDVPLPPALASKPLVVPLAWDRYEAQLVVAMSSH